MNKYHGRLRRDLLIGCAVFVLILGSLYAVFSGLVFRGAVYKRYEDSLSHIMEYVESRIDLKDMKQVIDTGIVSEKHAELQQFLNEYIDPIGLSYLYIIKFKGDSAVMQNVCTATNKAERAGGEEDMELFLEADWYDQETMNRFLGAWRSSGESFFEESSGYGTYYTGCRPIRYNGQVIAMICADYDIGSIKGEVARLVFVNVLITIGVCAAFIVLLIIWIDRNVTKPVTELESSARRFANIDRTDSKDARFLFFVPPKIRVKNEVKSLADAVEKMTTEMKDYVNGIISAEERERSANEKAEGLQTIAYQDALTRVKSKAAFTEKSDELMAGIMEGGAEFAIVMADLNFLKKINDTYGHTQGDKYLIGTAKIICQTYKHSPVYRVGGDEFVAVLEGQDYENREELLRKLRAGFREAWSDDSRQPWERYSAAVGMAEYSGEPDETVESVYMRADEIMYKNKIKMKKDMRTET